jgi:ArsR family transcriptional regulator
MKDLEMVLKACADRNRLRILKLLQKRPLCVCEIAFVLDISQPSVSRHLKKLKQAGMVSAGRDSFWTNYHLDPANGYALEMLSCIKGWLNDSDMIARDMKRVKRADRDKLCCEK